MPPIGVRPLMTWAGRAGLAAALPSEAPSETGSCTTVFSRRGIPGMVGEVTPADFSLAALAALAGKAMGSDLPLTGTGRAAPGRVTPPMGERASDLGSAFASASAARRLASAAWMAGAGAGGRSSSTAGSAITSSAIGASAMTGSGMRATAATGSLRTGSKVRSGARSAKGAGKGAEAAEVSGGSSSGVSSGTSAGGGSGASAGGSRGRSAGVSTGISAGCPAG